MLHVVLDTNIFVSSLLVKEGIPAQVLKAWRDRQYALSISPAINSVTLPLYLIESLIRIFIP